MGTRRQARETALQLLYLCDITHFKPEDVGEDTWTSFKLQGPNLEFSKHLFEGSSRHKQQLDLLISGHAENWTLDRMAALDRNILRLAAFEITDMPETPINVIIDEAVEIAKKYSTVDSGKFVNGILDKLKTARNPEKEKPSSTP